MTIKKITLTILFFSLTSTWVFGYEEIECTTDPVFAENSCNQCFDWWEKWQWVNIWLLNDKWVNNSDSQVLLYKEEQDMPTMLNLSEWNVTWSMSPNSEWFWEFDSELDSLYSSDYDWYILNPGAEINWLKSKLWYAYSLDKNTAEKWNNIWLLVYPIKVHAILWDWEPAIDTNTHKECVLYKSWDTEVDVVIPKNTTTKLPDTWPAEYILLLIIALLGWFTFLKFWKKA